MTRTERLAALLLYLQSRRKDVRRTTAAEIAAHFGVARRTILRDMAALSAMGVPIDATDGSSGGYVLPADFALAPLPLNPREALLLLFALGGLEKLPSAPFGDSRTTLVAKLRAMLSDAQLAVADSYQDRLVVDVPDRPAYTAPFLDILVAAARNATWLRATYRSDSGTEVEHTLLPAHISTTNGFWYCRAWSRERSAERTFRVDRFVTVAAGDAPDEFPTNRQSTPYDHPDHPQVSARLTPAGVAAVEREPHIAPHIRRSPDGSGTLDFRCPPSELDYYARYFLGFAAAATIDGPAELRARIRGLAEKIVTANSER